MLLINKDFLNDLKLTNLIKQINAIVFVRKINIDKHLIKNYLRLFIYLEDKIDDRVVVAHFCREIYVLNNLKVTFFLKINIIDFKRIIVDVNKQKLVVRNC